MRRLLLLTALLFVSVVVTAPTGCEDPYAGVTKVTLVNNCQNPFHPNGGDRLEVGKSREILSLKHGYSDDITIVRNGTKHATLHIVSLIDENEEKDYKVTVRVTEPDVLIFAATADPTDVVTVTVDN